MKNIVDKTKLIIYKIKVNKKPKIARDEGVIKGIVEHSCRDAIVISQGKIIVMERSINK